MARQPKQFSSRTYARSVELGIFIRVWILLDVVGGGLIWFFYGRMAALLGFLCITGAMLFILILYGFLILVERWAGE